MRAALQAVWVAFALLTAAAVGPATADESADVRKIIESRNAQLEQFYRTGQIDRVVASFAPDGRQYPNHMPPLVGRDAIRAFWTQAAASGTWVFTLKTEAVEARGDLAIERGRFTLSFTPRQGAAGSPPAFADRGSYLVHWQKLGGEWLIVADCPSSEAPLPTK